MYISTYICIYIFISPWINLFSLSFCLITDHWKRYIQRPVLDQIFSKNSWIGGESLNLAHIQYAKYYKNFLLLLRLSSSYKHQFCLCFSFNSSLLLKIASRGDSVESKCIPINAVTNVEYNIYISPSKTDASGEVYLNEQATSDFSRTLGDSLCELRFMSSTLTGS